eukprot:gb/GEZN01001855.1/.p1 GENE.gb/GEZN01001855.1/~~gb/GEZN01001855.1/.p1  ORF type:complete len:864 (-),score=42.68 gb/GEZN01001855.1/:191-2443(-)
MVWWYRLLGARIGHRVVIDTELISDPELLIAESDTILGRGVSVQMYHVNDEGLVQFEATYLHHHVCLQSGSQLMPDVTVLPHATLLPATQVGPSERVSAGPHGANAGTETGNMRRNAFAFGQLLGLCVVGMFSVLVGVVIWVILASILSLDSSPFTINRLSVVEAYVVLPLIMLTGKRFYSLIPVLVGMSGANTLQFVLNLFSKRAFLHLLIAFSISKTVTCLVVLVVMVLFKWSIIGKRKPGLIPLYSMDHLRLWVWYAVFEAQSGFMMVVIRTSCHWFGLLYRLLGARVGSRTTMDLMDLRDPDMLTVGSDCHLGSGALLCTSLMTARGIELDRIVLGDRSMAGMFSLLMPGTVLGDEVMLGGGSSVPVRNTRLESGWVYLGSPCTKMKLLREMLAVSGLIGDDIWHIPCYISAFLWIYPIILQIFVTFVALLPLVLCLWLLALVQVHIHPAAMVLFAGPYLVLPFLLSTLMAIACKWLFVCRQRAGSKHSMYSFRDFCRSSALIIQTDWISTWGFLLRGSAYLSSTIWAMGARVAGPLFLDSLSLCDVDMLDFEENAVVLSEARLYAHALEARTIRLDKISVGKGSVIDHRALMMPKMFAGDGELFTAWNLQRRTGDVQNKKKKNGRFGRRLQSLYSRAMSTLSSPAPENVPGPFACVQSPINPPQKRSLVKAAFSPAFTPSAIHYQAQMLTPSDIVLEMEGPDDPKNGRSPFLTVPGHDFPTKNEDTAPVKIHLSAVSSPTKWQNR